MIGSSAQVIGSPDPSVNECVMPKTCVLLEEIN